MQHQKAGNLVRKDQARRLRYQESQRIQAKAIKDQKLVWPLSESLIKNFASKLVK